MPTTSKAVLAICYLLVPWLGMHRSFFTLQLISDAYCLEQVDPKEAGFAKKAAKIFLRDGFVAVLSVLDPERLEVCRAGCIKVVRRILATDPTAGGNGHPSYVHSSHRYSITGEGAVIGHMGATPEFAYFCDPPVLSEVLTEIYGSKDYICNGFGGDFCLPGCVAFQPLHSDSKCLCCSNRVFFSFFQPCNHVQFSP